MMTSEKLQVPGGLVVMFDGMDGVGKSTQLELAADHLASQGYDVHKTRTNGGTPIGEAIRTEVLLRSELERPPLTDMALNFAQHAALHADLRARREQGTICLVDRSPYAIMAYQVFGSKLPEEQAEPTINLALAGYAAELIMVYTTTVETARHRRLAEELNGGRSAKSDYFESKPDSYFKDVSAGYSYAAMRYESPVIDASRSIEAVRQDTRGYINQAIATKLYSALNAHRPS